MTIMVSPPNFEMQTTETLPLGFDATALLSGAQTISAVAVVLTDIATGVAITLANPPSVSGNIISQIVVGSQLVAGHSYRLVVTFTAAASEIWSMPLRITVPF
jgi:cellulase/cellobiase CelA1